MNKIQNVDHCLLNHKLSIKPINYFLWILAWVILFLVFCHASVLADFYENFESGNLSNWTIDGTGVIEITTATSAEGSQSFHHNDSNSSSHSDGIHANFTGFQPNYVSFYVRSGSTTASDAYFVLKENSCGWVVYFYAKSNGKFLVYPSDESFSYNANQWYFVEFQNFDWTTRTFDYYVDGSLIYAGCSFRDSCSSVDFIELYNYSPGVNTYWDEINLTESGSAGPTPNNYPTAISLSNTQFAENLTIGTIIGTFSTTDADPGDTFTYSLVSGIDSTDNTRFVISGSDLKTNEVFDYETASPYSIRVQTDDNNGGTYEEIFILNVTNVNESPVIQPIADQSAIGEHEIQLDIFDPEYDNLTLSASSSNTNIVSDNNITFSGAGAFWTMTITPSDNQTGSTTITLNVDDNNGNVSNTSFLFQSIPVLELPENTQALPGGSFSLPLTLNNPENLGIYGLEAIISYDPTLLNSTGISLTGTVLENNYIVETNNQNSGRIIICFAANNNVYSSDGIIGYLNFDVIGGEGQSSSLTFVTASQNEMNVITKDGAFTVQINQSPSISNIANVTIDEDNSTSLTFTASDLESSPCSLSVNISSDNSVLLPNGNISYTCDNDTYSLNISPISNKNGTATISITVTDSLGLFDTETFDVQVTSINDSPQIDTISNKTTTEDTPTNEISFNISDIETNANNLLLIASSSDTNLIPIENIVFSGTGESRALVITPVENMNGTSTLTITVSDNDLTDSTSFDLTVTPVDDPPEIISPIANVSVNEDSANNTIDLTGVFSDVDNDNAAITKTIQSNSNPGLVNASIADNILTLDYLADQSGTADITVLAESNGKQVLDTFTVTVTALDDPPEILQSINDVIANEDDANYTIDLSNVFTDKDSDNNAITKTILSNTNELLVTASISGNTLTLAYLADQSGTAEITVLATSNGLTVEDTFTITVAAIDDNPEVLTPMEDLTANEDDPAQILDLSNIFTDKDNDDTQITKTVQSNTNSSLVSTNISGNTLTLTFSPNNSGSADITIKGTSNGKTINDTFTVTVNTVDDPPYVISEIENLSLVEDASDTDISLANVFADIDNDNNAIIKTIYSNTNESLLNASINGDTLSISLQQEKNGTAIISVMANSNGLTVLDTFTVDVNPEDDPPVVVAAIANVSANEDAADTTIDLSNVFTDVDNEDSTIVKTVNNNTNTSLVSANISGNTLTLSYLADQIGTADITVQAESNGKQVLDTFTVTVTALDDPPEILQSINDVTANEDDANYTIDLSNVFTDKDSDNNAITKTILSNTNELLVTASINGNTLTLAYLADQSGTAEITVLATSNGLTVEDTFTITVAAIDDNPEILTPMEDLTANEDDPAQILDLSNIFTDKDNDDAQIIKTVQSNTNSSLVSTNISGNTLTLTFSPNNSGSADITIKGTSNGKTINDTFTVTVNTVDDPPYVLSEIENLSLVEDASDTDISLANVFADIDNDNNAIIKTIYSNTNESLLNASINGDTLSINLQQDENGTAIISVMANSNGLTVLDTFTVDVNPEDDPPVVVAAIANVSANEDAADTTIDLSNVFTDIDNEDSTIVKTVNNNTNPSLVSANISGNTLTLSYLADQIGTADITVQAESNGKQVLDTFTVTVTALDDPPEILQSINDVTANEDDANDTIDLTNVFTDKDSDNNAITKTILTNNNESLLTASISGNTLTLAYLADQNGTAEITVLATSNGLNVTDSFMVTVAAMDDSPQLSVEIDDVVVNENANDTIIPLTNVFVDIDKDVIVKTVEINTNETLVTAIISGNTLTLKYQPDTSGNAAITIRGTSNGQFEEDTFMITVISVDSPPEVANEIADVSVDMNAASMAIALTDVFFDPDNDIISISLQNNANPELVTPTVSGNNLYLSFQSSLIGEAEITIRATANGKTVDDIFIIYVTATDVGPEVSMPISDITVLEDSSDSVVNLESVFTDPDDDDQNIVKSVYSNSNDALVTASASGNELTLSYVHNSSGTATIVIRGTSKGKTVDTSFKLTVLPVDDPPMTANPIEHITTEEDALSQTIDLINVFSDIDSDDNNILKTLTENTNNSLVSASISNNELLLSYQPEQSGTATITVRGTSNGLFVETSFSVTVNSVDDPPVVINSIDDITMDASADTKVIALTDVFTDIDNNDASIVKSIQNNTNSNLVTTFIADNSLTLSLQPGMEGEAQITVKAISNGLTVNDSFNVFVDASDLAPVLANPIEDITVVENAASTIIPLASVFTDPDNDDLTIEKTIYINTNEQLVTGIINGNQLTLTYAPDINGVATLTVRGISKGKTVDNTFNVTVLAIDSPPEIIDPLKDVMVDEDAAKMAIPLTGVFTDVDNDDSYMTLSIVENNNETLLIAIVENNNLSLDYQPNQYGSALITIQAMSNGLTVIDQISIAVNPVDDPPKIGTYIDDVTVNEDADNTIIDLSTAFTDIDNETIVKTVQNNTQPSLVAATIIDNTLTLDYLADQNGIAVITIAGLSNGKTVTQTFQVSVASINDAPQADDSQISVLEDTHATAHLQAKDIEQDALTFNLISQPQHGQLTLIDQFTGEFIFVPDNNFYGSDAFTFNVSDGQLTSQTAQVTIMITPVNDLPFMSELTNLEIYEGTTLTQIFTVSDADRKHLTITAITSDTQLLPYEQFTWLGGQAIHSNKVLVDVNAGDISVSLTIKPASGLSGTASVTLITIDEAGATIEKAFIVLVKKYHILATSQGPGKIQPSGIVEVNTGEPYVKFTITPETGYVVDHIIVDGNKLSARPMYTFWNVSEDHAITAIFSEPVIYTISTQAGSGGSIEPSGNVLVEEGNSKTFKIQANTGFVIDYLRVDDVYVAATNEYIFNNVSKPHKLQAFFEAVPAPIASFKASPVSGSSPLEVSFTDQSQNTITSHEWNYGDGTSGVLQNPKHTYFSPGKYTVSLTVKGPGGSDTLVKSNLIVIHDLQVEFTATPTSGAFPLTSTFTAQTQDALTGVIWNFGDGNTSTQLQASHVYNAPGSYTVQLTAFAQGTSATVVKTNYINVKGRNISGRVTGSDTGMGLAGYQVEVIHRQDNLRVGETYTDANGYYTFVCESSVLTCLTTFQKIPATSDIVLAVWPPFMKNDYYMQYYSGQSLAGKATLISTVDSNQTNINLVLEKVNNNAITGKVHDNGVPEANIQVNVYSEKLSYGLSTLADTNGVYTLNGLKPSDDYCVYVWDDQQNTETYFSLPANQTPGQDIPSYSVYKKDSATQVEPTNPALKNIDILFDRNVNERGSIKGNISTSDNKAANGIWVYAFSDAIGTGNGAFTDQNGDYTITGLTQVSDSDPYTMGYIVAVHSVQDNQSNINTNLWYTYQAYPGVTDKSLAEKVKTGTNNINFTLKTQCSLSGTVSDIYGSTVPGAEVKVRSDKTGQVVSAVTNQFGKYAITGLSPVDDYLVTASAVYYPLMYYKGKSTQAQADRVDLSKDDITGIDFALDTGLIIQGVVYLENSAETAPEGLWVNIWSETTSTGSDVPTDNNGRYQITGLNPNATDYIISIRKQDYMASFYRDNKDSDLMNDTVYSSEDAQGVSATDLQKSVDRNLILRTGLTISGIVQYNGLPVSNIRVEAWSEATGGWGVDVSSDTITDGFNYKITGLPPGEYNVKIQPLYYQDDSYRVELSNVDIKNLYFPLKDLENMICGTVNGLDAGKKAQITAWSEGTGFNKILMLTGTGNDIDYTITQVKPSTDYRVKFTGYDYPLQVYNKKTNEEEANLITVSSGIVSGIDFHITSGTQMISGTITFPGSAVAGDIAWVDAFSPSTGSDGSAKVILVEGRTANYQITGLKEAPDFTVVAWGKQYKEQYYNQKAVSANANLINTGDAILDDSIDFDLTPGATISGTIYEDGLPIQGFQISAISDKTSSFGGATSASDGSYLIEGLDLANDFVIKAQKSGMAPFYYNDTSTTRDEKLATRVSTVGKVHVTGINIQTAVLESISGTVRDEEGKALSGIWINVWSDLQKTGEGMYTLENGSYIINALPKSEDYKVSIGEHAALIYVPEEKTGVKSNSSGIDFTLRRAYQLKGTVGNTAGEILVKAEVELYSEKEDFYVWTKTDGSGTYNIQCVPSANDYILSVMPPENTSYITFNESGLQINEITTSNRSMQKDIILKTGSHIEGYVYKTDTTTPVIDSEIFVYSKGNNFSAEGGTDDNGYFRINNIPIASDYEVTVKTTDFAKAIKVDQVAGTSINFVLEAGGVISGKVIEQDGAPLADVLVEVTSQSAHISGIQRTDVNGGFAISGMPRYLDTGYEVTDYVVKVFPNNYAEQSQGQKRVGEYVTFVCKKAIIKGTITDSLGNPIPDGVIVAIKLYNNLTEGGYIKKTDAASDGTFSLEGMLFNKDYQIVIHVMKSKMTNKVQWISQNGEGISGRSEAGKFQAGSNVDVQLMGTWDK